MKQIIIILFAVLILYKTSYSQSIGLTLGGGFFSGNSPNVSAFTSSLFVNSPPVFNDAFSLRFSFFYDADYNVLLPNSTNQYNPFIKGLSLKGIITQHMDPIYYVEEGMGALVINDRIFSGIDATDYGIIISFGVGIDLRKNSTRGFLIGAGTDYSFTITNSYAKYFSIYIMGHYFF
jgi:hypothetical protein